MTKAQRARDMKAADPSLTAFRIARVLRMDPSDVRRALKRQQTKTWSTRIRNEGRERAAMERT